MCLAWAMWAAGDYQPGGEGQEEEEEDDGASPSPRSHVCTRAYVCVSEVVSGFTQRKVFLPPASKVLYEQ